MVPRLVLENDSITHTNIYKNLLPIRDCECCGDVFQPTRDWHIYCDASCRNAINYEVNRDYRLNYMREYRKQKRIERAKRPDTKRNKRLSKDEVIQNQGDRINQLEALVGRQADMIAGQGEMIENLVSKIEMMIATPRQASAPPATQPMRSIAPAIEDGDDDFIEMKKGENNSSQNFARAVLGTTVSGKPKNSGIKKLDIGAIAQPNFEDDDDDLIGLG